MPLSQSRAYTPTLKRRNKDKASDHSPISPPTAPCGPSSTSAWHSPELDPTLSHQRTSQTCTPQKQYCIQQRAATARQSQHAAMIDTTQLQTWLCATARGESGRSCHIQFSSGEILAYHTFKKSLGKPTETYRPESWEGRSASKEGLMQTWNCRLHRRLSPSTKPELCCDVDPRSRTNHVFLFICCAMPPAIPQTLWTHFSLRLVAARVCRCSSHCLLSLV